MAEQDDPLAGTEFAGGNIPGVAKFAPASAGAKEDPLAGTEFAQSAPSGGTRPTSASSTALQPKIAQKSAEEYANMPIGDVLSEAASNLGPSAMTAYQGLAHAVTNPTETLGALGQIGSGLYSKAQGALGVQQNAAEKAKTEALVNALGQHYGETYGSVGGLKRAVATDPFSVGMDIASIVPVVGPGARAVGLTGETAGMLGKAASVAGSAASAMDPVQLALNVGKGAAGAGATGADWALKGTQTALSGVPTKLLDVMQAAGETSDAGKAATFKRFMSGNGDHAEIAQAAMDGLNELKQKAQQSYLSDKANLARATTQLPMDDVVKKLNELNDFVGFDPTGATKTSRFPEAQRLVANVNQQIADSLSSTNPASRTLIDLDNLKQSLNTVAESASGSVQGKIGEVAKAVRDTIANPAIGGDPIYAEMMDNYSRWRNELKDYQTGLGLGNKTAQTTKVARMMKATKAGPTSTLLDSISQTQAGQHLPFMLAGAAANPWFAQGLRGALEYPPAIIAAALHPAGWAPLAAGAAASSPRLAGASQFAIGRTKRALQPISDAAGVATSQPVTYGLTRVGEAEQQPQASGGRIGRATGGRAHGAMTADMLIAAAERAKKNDGNATSSLLDQPDEAITRALAIANKHI